MLVEICGNCIDDNLNDLTDFEDPACCSDSAGQVFITDLRRGKIKPRAADESLLKLRSIPFGMKLFADKAEMEAIPRIRRPQHVHTLDQLVGQASRLGWTVGVTSEDLVGAQCRAVVGLGSAKTDEWKSGRHMTGVWFETVEDATAHQAAIHCVPDGQYEALAIGPLAAGKIADFDIALFYAMSTDGKQFTARERIPTEGMPHHPRIAAGGRPAASGPLASRGECGQVAAGPTRKTRSPSRPEP